MMMIILVLKRLSFAQYQVTSTRYRVKYEELQKKKGKGTIVPYNSVRLLLPE